VNWNLATVIAFPLFAWAAVFCVWRGARKAGAVLFWLGVLAGVLLLVSRI
jgi:hypothetical protein